MHLTLNKFLSDKVQGWKERQGADGIKRTASGGTGANSGITANALAGGGRRLQAKELLTNPLHVPLTASS